MIIFHKDLLPINPAYNDSIIQFESDVITGATKAIISVNGTPFIAVPNANKFTFNFKDIIKNLINSDRFFDGIEPDLTTDEWIYDDPTINRKIIVDITVQSLTTGETTTKNYSFHRGVEQLIGYNQFVNEMPLDSTIRILLPTRDKINHLVRYFEGYPFDFSIDGIMEGDEFYFKNITTNQTTDPIVALKSDVKRFFLSDGANNTMESDVLIDSSTLNKLEFYVNDEFKGNINILKQESDCGVYLKWLNSKGTYSYWKFDSVYKETITPKTVEDFQGSYDNLQNLTSTSHLIGKTASNTLAVTTTYQMFDANYLKDLVTAPAVWYYIYNQPFQQQHPFAWIGCGVSDTPFVPRDTKNSKGKLSLTITLPELNTQFN